MRALSQSEKESLLNNIKNYQDLRVLSFEKDFKNREKLIYDSSITSILGILVFLFAFILLSVIFDIKWFENEITKNIFFIIVLIVMLGFFYFIFEFLNKIFLAKIKKFIFIVIPFEFWVFFS